MRPLTPDDLMPLAEYADRRLEFFESHRRYLDRYRRVRVGPQLTLVFENRQTLWFRVHELVRVARLAEPGLLRAELAVYNRLLPGRDHLQAALLIDVPDGVPLSEALAPWRGLAGDAVRLRLGDRSLPAALLTDRPEDHCVGAAHWLRIVVPADARPLLADPRVAAVVEAEHGAYRHDSGPLGADVRQSLLEDLELSERDEVAARA
jgi:hypothetical protein